MSKVLLVLPAEDFGFFFNCTDTSGSNIWKYSETQDTIEFRTTIYFTNVRPVDPADGTKVSLALIPAV